MNFMISYFIYLFVWSFCRKKTRFICFFFTHKLYDENIYSDKEEYTINFRKKKKKNLSCFIEILDDNKIVHFYFYDSRRNSRTLC